MNLRFKVLVAVLVVSGGPVLGKAPERSMLPETRPGTVADAVPEVMGPRPMPRPMPETAEVSGNPPEAEAPAEEVAADDVVIAEGDADPEQETLIAEMVETEETGVEVGRGMIMSPVPIPRPGEVDLSELEAPVAEVPDVVNTAALARSPVPVPRPRVVVRTAPPQDGPEKVVPASTRVVTPAPPKPEARPRGLLAAIFRAPDKPSKYPREGSVCGDPAIRGQVVPPIPAKLRGCGIDNPVRITAVDGVALTTPATVSCETAGALRKWVSGAVKPVIGKTGGGLAALRVAASYSCRTRNNVPGAKISEHGRGKAIDISAFILKDGSVMTVLNGWRNKVQAPLLRAIHANACGPFGTVLGPHADRYHQDHFHLDVASHGYGPYCR